MKESFITVHGWSWPRRELICHCSDGCTFWALFPSSLDSRERGVNLDGVSQSSAISVAKRIPNSDATPAKNVHFPHGMTKPVRHPIGLALAQPGANIVLDGCKYGRPAVPWMTPSTEATDDAN